MGVTGAAVKQTVVAAGGSGREVEALDKYCLKAAHGAVACRAGSCGASADDDHVILAGSVFHVDKAIGQLTFRYGYLNV